MRPIVLTLMVAGVLATVSSPALAHEAPAQVPAAQNAVAQGAVAKDAVQDQATLVQFHFVSMKRVRTGVVTLLNVRAFVDSARIEAEEAELSMADGRLRLVLNGGGVVTLPQRTQVEVVTGPYDRLQRDEGLTRILHGMLFRFGTPLAPVMIIARR